MGRNYDQVFQDAKHALGAPGKQVTRFFENLAQPAATAALLAYQIAGFFPHHTGPKARVAKLFDQACRVIGAGNCVPDGLGQRQVLDPLRRPVGLDTGRGDAPYFFRVGSKKNACTGTLLHEHR